VQHITNPRRCHHSTATLFTRNQQQLPSTSFMIKAANNPACLLTGDPLLNDLCCIILRSWIHLIGICTDIEKAFLHFFYEDDRDCTRFLWLNDPQEFVTYRFKVILFGAVQYVHFSCLMLLCTVICPSIVLPLHRTCLLWTTGCHSESEAVQY